MDRRLDFTPKTNVIRFGVVGVVVKQGQFLVIRRSRHVEAPLWMCFPGGSPESGETEEQALIREFREELSVDVVPLRSIWKCTTPWNVQLSWWLAQVHAEEPFTPNSQEVESYHWLSLEELSGRHDLLSSNHDFLRAVSNGEIILE